MVDAPRSDAGVPAFVAAMGLPGLIDSHVHFMPESVMAKVWAYFDSAGPLTGREWPITYRWPEPRRLAHLRGMGVRAFPSLVYAHKPDMEAWLNEWARSFAAAHNDVLMTATIFPEPTVTTYLDTALRAGLRVVKVHVQVGGYDPRDPLLDEAWGMLADAGVPVVVHAGSGPAPGAYTRPGPIAEVLARHPELPLIAAHMGMPEYSEFLDLAERYDNVKVDTTMCFTDFGSGAEVGTELAPRLDLMRDKILFGADFPNLPYPYAHQIEALVRLGLGEDWLRAVCWDNAAALFGIQGVISVDTIGHSLSEGFFMFWDTLWALVLGFTLSGVVQAFVSRAQLQRVMGDHRPRTIVRTSLLGAASSSCSYAASALARTLFARGADFTTAMVFMIASTNLVVELGIVLWLLIGWQFALAEFVGGSIMIALLTMIGPRVFRGRFLDAARRQVGDTTSDHAHAHGEPAVEAGAAAPHWRSKAAWVDASTYTIADLRMLRRELVVGFVVAGFLAVAVPARVYRDVFLSGHGGWTTIENALVGPVIAFVSFVCSIGNVPLAAALWTSGVSFGGIVAFLFADLLAAPLVAIYRKLYAGRQAVVLVAVLWAVMSLGGLLTELLFRGVHLLPRIRPAQPVHTGFRWNATTVLDLGFIAVFALVWWLSRHRDSHGSSERFAIDPTCGMQVEKANPGAISVSDGVTSYFCSDGCRDSFATVGVAQSTNPTRG